jgi:hypothetical protein
VSIDYEQPPLRKKIKMTNPQEADKKLLVEDQVSYLGRLQLLGDKTQ